MKQASSVEFIVWLIVAIVVMVAKGLGKLATPPEKEAPASPSRPLQSKPAVRRPTRRPVAKVTPPVIQGTEPVTEQKPPPKPSAAPPAQPSRSSQWAAALRDRQNIRNVIISAEIIGPPRGT